MLAYTSRRVDTPKITSVQGLGCRPPEGAAGEGEAHWPQAICRGWKTRLGPGRFGVPPIFRARVLASLPNTSRLEVGETSPNLAPTRRLPSPCVLPT